MFILSAMQEIIGVIWKYTALYAIANIPRFFFNSIINHKAATVCTVTLPITNYRCDDPLKDANLGIKMLRLIYKVNRIFFCSFTYYFCPFFIIFINF